MPGAMELLFALGRDDLRVVRCRCGRVRQDYPFSETPGLLCDSQTVCGRHGGRPSPTDFPANDGETFKNRIRILPAGPEPY